MKKMIKNYLLFNDWQKEIQEKLGKSEWITVYSYKYENFERIVFYSALIHKKYINESLNHAGWDLFIGSDYRPGFNFSFENGSETTNYFRLPSNNVEPLVIRRDFYSKKSYWEISEEFRLYFDLYEYRDKGKFVKIDEDGDEDEVILVEESRIQVKLKYLKEFLAVKKMSLAIFFEFNRYTEKSFEELHLEPFDDEIKKDNYIYALIVQECISDKNKKIHAKLIGKKLIPGLKDFKPQRFNKTEGYEEFITGVDENGKEILQSCNPDITHGLIPVYFNKDVLLEYYSKPEKYTVEDGILSCDGLWSLSIDNNHIKHIAVSLRDIGQYLSSKEQKRWKRFNITPQNNKISKTAYERWIKANPCSPQISDLYFKQKFESFQEEWEKKYGWKLFKPLRKEDEHCFKCLRIPLTEEQKEFDEQVGFLVKIIIDSLNEEELEKGVTIGKNNPKGIDKFEAFIKKHKIESNEMITFFRNLQTLRSAGSAHRKGSNYNTISKIYSIGKKDFIEIFDKILLNAIRMLNTLEKYFLGT